MDHYNNDQYQYTSGPNPGQLIPSGMGEQEPQPGRGRKEKKERKTDYSDKNKSRRNYCALCFPVKRFRFWRSLSGKFSFTAVFRGTG